ncbi:type II toxin-antitoxin system VapC family toxin [Sphingobium sp. EP60837]|uniref:type II toxin-antitoxin system VapC family toxin n=1 Tax=Sphingobium sp. EP60837 TaxID=1855519 RepID=UPI0007DE205C|nr:type II toxin-antitoxin system VapC family toxin [Sphingobium sp. EP60837]ANI79212.1 Toxin FitB [Sphingobium sp. EP60837]
MIVLDTNVVLEAMKPSAEPVVVDWLNRQPAETLFLTSVTLAELLFGITALTEGKRKNALASALDRLLKLFGERILPFETNAAQSYAALAFHAQAVGKYFPTPDGYIAAIAKATGFSVATRDTAPFDAVGIAVINPWISR